MTADFRLPDGCRSIVAIPACNEQDRIGDCLAAIAVQRDASGAPLPAGSFAVLLFANNCRDGTADEARLWGPLCPFPLHVVEAVLPAAQSNAGYARKIALDLAADVLERNGDGSGLLFTTDADSSVCSTWIAGTMAEIAAGADAVAGYIEAQPRELIGLGSAFVQRGRLEDAYLACVAEIVALCDPIPHDPWPNHRVASGASFAVTLSAYRSIGGLPPRPLGEDVALAEALVAHGFRLRHPLHVCVTTSCRLDGRAPGGAADTMKLRREEPDATCDADMEPALRVLERAAWKHRLRGWQTVSPDRLRQWALRLGLAADSLASMAAAHPSFEPFWRAVEGESPRLRRGPPMRPSQLAGEIAAAQRVLRRLRRASRRPA